MKINGQILFDAEQAKEIDRISIEELQMPSLVLMERASLKTAEAVARDLSRKDSVVAVCGSGNNGGDGVAAARMLFEWGYDVTVLLTGEEKKFTEEMRRQVDIARNLEMKIVRETDLGQYSVIIDAIFGIGLAREITGRYKKLIESINDTEAKVYSVDIPSGIHATTGKVLGIAVRANVTVTFGSGKLGLYLFPGRMYGGRVLIEDIGFPRAAREKMDVRYVTYGRRECEKYFPKRIPDSNKGSYGRLLVIAGSENMGGAAYFAARAGYLTGAGLVRVISHENNRVMLQERLPEALIGVYGDQCPDLAQELSWATAVVIGPGLGRLNIAGELLRQVLQIKDMPVLIDADGLNILAECPKYFDRERRLLLPENYVITPHLKEMSRLLDCSVEEIKDDPLYSVRHAAAGAAVVQKDAVTLVSDGEQIYVNSSGNNALAKGGSGDVLSGMIGGLLARGTDTFTAASLGVYLHGLTAEEYVKDRSSSSMLATDILEMLPRVIKK